jgi:hypothetical protein
MTILSNMRFVTFLLLFLTTGALAQLKPGQVDASKVPAPSQHYLPEYTFDVPSDPAQWQKEKPGLNVSFASTNVLYLRSEVPQLSGIGHGWEKTGWRGERLNAQLLVWSPDTLKQVRVAISDLTGAKGNKISNDNIRIHLVRYVLSNFPYGAEVSECSSGDTDVVYLMPDRFEEFERFDLPGRSVRPLWLSVNIPSETEPGEYTGTVTVRSEKEQQTLKMTVHVQNHVLPKPGDWSFRLDLWQNPWAVSSYYRVKPWSDEHKALLKKHLRLYADAGGTYITTYAVHSPWSDNSYWIEGNMIEWLKQKDGSWKFDYDIFDQYVELAMEVGVDEAITIYTPVPWGYRFRYMDKETGNYVYAEWSPESKEFKQVWKVFLDDLHAHLKKKGWLEKTYLGINENPLDITLAAAEFIKAHSEDWKITYAGNWHPELKSILDDYSPVIGSEAPRDVVRDRSAAGLTTTFYVCCTPAQPNNFIFSPPVESTYIGWYASAYGYNGFLRWAYDAWPADPLRDARHTFWPAGDCFLVYPGGVSSIRFEKLREGIVDFEKIRILKEEAGRSSNKNVKKSLAALERHMESFIDDEDYSKRVYDVPEMTNAVVKGKGMIDNLTAALETK